MQLDQTRIAIRERGLLDTIDLALLVIRDFAAPLRGLRALAIVPLALINYALVGWMAPVEYDTDVLGFRYLWNMTVLIFIEAPLAEFFIVAYLGPAVFLEDRTIRQIAGDVLRQTGPLLLCQGLLRVVLVVWGLYLITDRMEANGFIEGFLMVCLCGWSAVMRSFRPYINEIILLEKNPLLAGKLGTITIGKRSSHLHSPYSGDLLVRWIGTAGISFLLAIVVLYAAYMLQGTLVSDWAFYISPDHGPMLNIDWFKLEVVYPACLWLVVAFLAVVRFLSYLDLRIRHEGWEVELFMRAEALRLAETVA